MERSIEPKEFTLPGRLIRIEEVMSKLPNNEANVMKDFYSLLEGSLVHRRINGKNIKSLHVPRLHDPKARALGSVPFHLYLDAIYMYIAGLATDRIGLKNAEKGRVVSSLVHVAEGIIHSNQRRIRWNPPTLEHIYNKEERKKVPAASIEAFRDLQRLQIYYMRAGRRFNMSWSKPVKCEEDPRLSSHLAGQIRLSIYNKDESIQMLALSFGSSEKSANLNTKGEVVYYNDQYLAGRVVPLYQGETDDLKFIQSSIMRILGLDGPRRFLKDFDKKEDFYLATNFSIK